MGANLGTRLFTRFFGELVGTDSTGNRYYHEKRPAKGWRVRRWVVYGGKPDASSVPAEWQGWLTHTLAAPPTVAPPVERAWQKEHEPNLTGTPLAYRPPGAIEKGGQRLPATGDYDSWTPG